MSTTAIDLKAIRWSDWWANPYPLYKVMREESPVFYDEQNDTYLVTLYDDCWNVLTDAERFSNVPFHLVDEPEKRISTLRNADPPRHTWIRQIVAPLFIPKAMRRLGPYFRIAEDLPRNPVLGAEAAVGADVGADVGEIHRRVELHRATKALDGESVAKGGHLFEKRRGGGREERGEVVEG